MPSWFAVAISGSQFRWPGCKIPYTIDPALPNQARVTDAIAHWEANTRIRFVPRTTEADFVTFRPGSGCSAQVGRREVAVGVDLEIEGALGRQVVLGLRVAAVERDPVAAHVGQRQVGVHVDGRAQRTIGQPQRVAVGLEPGQTSQIEEAGEAGRVRARRHQPSTGRRRAAAS